MPPSFSNNDSVEPSLSLDLKFKDVLWWFSNAFPDIYFYILKEGGEEIETMLSLSTLIKFNGICE